MSRMADYTLFTDGGSRGNPGSAAIGVYAIDATGTVILEHAETIGNSTNNIAEYCAVATGLELLKQKVGKGIKDKTVELKLDSELVKKQLNGEYQIKDAGLVPYFVEIHNLRVSSFPNLKLTHVPRAQNKEADRLVNEALDAA
jgi:Ribonuclease HI